LAFFGEIGHVLEKGGRKQNLATDSTFQVPDDARSVIARRDAFAIILANLDGRHGFFARK
jgi:hypothetical protein